MARRHFDAANLLDHLDHVAHPRPLIRRSSSASHGDLKQCYHLLFNILVPHQLQIKHLSRPFLPHHGLDPPREVHHPTAVPAATGTATLDDGGALPGEDLKEEDAEGKNVGLLGELTAVNGLRSTVAVGTRGGGGGKEGESEVRDAGIAGIVDKDVGGLDVAVGKPEGPAGAVDECQPTGCSGGDLQPRDPVQWCSSWPSVTCYKVSTEIP